jgi:RimJ/RimL family protein N-acetyltransferase
MEYSPAISIPRLETRRLRLREPRMADFDAFARNLQDPLATKFVTFADRRDAWRRFGLAAGAWLLQGAGWWSVESRETGELVGSVGAFFRETWPEIELGWTIFRLFWGRGFATEAASETVRYAFEVRKERRVTALVDAENLPSVRVAEHLGMRHEADVDLWGAPVRRYARASESSAIDSST